jgi:uncharacterized protein
MPAELVRRPVGANYGTGPVRKLGLLAQTLRSAYEAFARQDVPSVLAAFQPDISWTAPDSLPFGGHYSGHDEVVGFFQTLGDYWTDLHVDPEQFIDGGETIVVIGKLRATGANGALEQPFVHVWTMRDGKAGTFVEFGDTARINQILGAPALTSK